ncbi:TPA: tail fiber assembly protein [Vibrio vulnificus]
MTPKEKAVNEGMWDWIRKQRDYHIATTDWTQMTDAPLSAEKKAEFTTYRQKLRDIPQTYSNPDDVIWPEKPTV